MKSWKNYIPIYGIYYMWVKLECEREEFELNLLLHLIILILVLIKFI